MTLPELVPRASENLLATYLALGRELPGAEIVQNDGYLALLSDLPHPSGNFASRLRLDPWTAAELRDLAASRLAFQAVALPDDGPEHLDELLQRAGFRISMRLVTMVASPSEARSDLAMLPCEGEIARRRIARFMADSFFAHEPHKLREAMAKALGRAEALSIYAHHVREKPTAAVALVREAEMMGVYNLCVAGPRRGKGHGSAVIAWCLAQAAAERLPVCLQCAASLEPWYARHGFVRVGSVGVWSLV